MATTELTRREDLEDLITGLKFFGTGGGGSDRDGLRLLLQEVEEGRAIRWVDLESIPDDAGTVRVSNTGSTAGESEDDRKKRYALGLGEPTETRNHGLAVKELAQYTGRTIDTLIPPELGARNTAVTLSLAAYLGLRVADADYAGRAIPELANTTPCVLGYTIWPIATVDRWGNTCIIKKAQGPRVAERLARHMAMASFGNTGLAGFLLDGRTAKKAAVAGTLTESLELGRAIRSAGERGEDPVSAILSCTGGKVIFTGEITRTEASNHDGFFWGEHFLEGDRDFSGKTLKVWFKNENLVSWLDESPYVTCPDLISLVEAGTGMPISNTEVKTGQKVAVVAVKARAVYRTPEGLKVLSPRAFGFSMDYRPLEEIV